MIKKASPISVVLSASELKRVGNFFSLLMNVKKRMKNAKRRNKVSKSKVKISETIGLWIHRPCFYLQLFYPKMIGKGYMHA